MEEANNPIHEAKRINILLVEDNEADIEIALIVFKRSIIKNNVYVVRDGEEALRYLHGEGDFADRSRYPMPQIMLLDINMPKINGFELLSEIKQDDRLKLIPIIMMTSSRNEEDIVKSYGTGAAAYLSKPVEHEDFIKIVDNLNLFWQKVVFPKSNDD